MTAGEQREEYPADSDSRSGRTADSKSSLDRLGALLHLAAGVPLFFFLFSFLSPWLMLAELAVNFQVQWFAALFVAGLAALWFRRWWLALVALLAAAVALAGILPIYLPDPANVAPAANPRLRVMSFNLLVSNRRQAEVLAEIRRQNPDVLIIVEYTTTWQQALAPLRREYPHIHEEPRGHGFGIALFSKIPLRQFQTVARMPQASELPVLRAVVDFAGRPLEIVGVHLINPLGNVQRNLRDGQFAALASELVAEPAERVVAGDFNCTSWSQDLQTFLGQTRLRDSRQGFGLQPSWYPASLPWLAIPIDHALVSPGLSVVARKTGDRAGSDHAPVVVDLAWREAVPVDGKR